MVLAISVLFSGLRALALAFGFIPDVGGSRILADAPGFSGFYLGLCAMRMDASDAIYAGFADSYVPVAALATTH